MEKIELNSYYHLLDSLGSRKLYGEVMYDNTDLNVGSLMPLDLNWLRQCLDFNNYRYFVKLSNDAVARLLIINPRLQNRPGYDQPM